MADPTLYAWLGVLVGAFLGTLWPYLNVLRAKPGTKFDWNYAAALLVSLALAMPTSLVAYAWVEAVVPASLTPYLADPWFIFTVGVFVGAAWNRGLINHIVDRGKGKPTPATVAGGDPILPVG